MSDPSDPTPPPPPLPAAKLSSLSETSKKKSRLQWDEDNLISNAQEMERAGPRMKIDEPKTPYVQGSETGSSTSGSARPSPPESPSFIPGERLVGFRSLEASMNAPGASSDGASSTGSAGRSVQIMEDVGYSSGSSSPKSKEIFAVRRKAHYRNEFRPTKDFRMSENGDEDDDDDDEDDEEGKDAEDDGVEDDDDDDEDNELARNEHVSDPRSLSQQWEAALPNGHHDVGNGVANGFARGIDASDAMATAATHSGHTDESIPAENYVETQMNNNVSDITDDSTAHLQASDRTAAD